MKPARKILLFCLLAALPLRGQERGDALREEVAFLCDSLQAGRGFGTPGAQSVTFYLLRELRNAGLRTTVQSFEAAGRAGHNVVAVTPGRYRRYIVVGAWFDGLGTLGGTRYPGADANASGVAALLALARSLPASPRGETGIVFVAFDGHTADLAGSRAFLERYRQEYPPALMVNLDILGSALAPVRPDRPDYLIALGGGAYAAALSEANRTARLDLHYDYYGSRNFTELFYRKISDQRWFLEAGIPAVMFTSGITDLTNKAADLPGTLDFPLFGRRVQLIGNWLAGLL